ncbi:C2 domain containing protein [Pyrenophora tritici-repentis]|nr:Ca2+-dependent lipid-binding protein contains C2 domain protein [Pyrenophora tritici-repentis]KAI0587044.1 Ca2+-dependent lipid-binding protein contains C2 domain protein [Pyrenophora tritici-repentis]KAI0608654.1 Ca2+-dependent lipid-binding protein contains C2 domain protein [Pyrenophora tritici-repentis]KAI0621109.1 Ca2+-dependent lipid-binding protein contains C2 domain protein [Pyrenophora tritici-repentis]KAI1538526.1 C2 domain containing protein [Pyrenophora tritici-repentis]
MSTKSVTMSNFGGAHAAGIFSDMTVDGPIIGTLVVIMDRARNLPNKRTMGKQDPYCAARLGKEAKKTRTDKRGGQTPKWDQELRFTVHDSPDYNRLKVSVFNDDKKTELIGEAYANLQSVITPGGGQSDEWLGLNCKGKYAGEIRMEMTYYDTRPKTEKQVSDRKRESAKAETYGHGHGHGVVGGAREMAPIKRRPLPNDPTGASPSPVHTPEHRGLRARQAPASYGQEQYQDPSYQVAPLRTSRSREYSDEQVSPMNPYYGQLRFIEAPPTHEEGSLHRRRSAMQPMVEDEDDMPPPPPTHKRNASTVPHRRHESPEQYHNEAPEPLSFSSRSREQSRRLSYDTAPQNYESNDYAPRQPGERRYTHPRMPAQQSSRPTSRQDMMVPSPLRQETLRQEPPALPSSLIAGLNPARQEIEAVPYEAPPTYETPPRLRHYSEPAEYRAITQYETPVQSQELVHHSAYQNNDYYPHDPPEQPRQRSPPAYDTAAIVKPRATSPGVNPRYTPNPPMDRYSPNLDIDRYSPNPVTERSSRMPARSMPTRKSVSPRPPPPAEDFGERRLSGVAFNPDSFDVYNPRVSKSPIPSDDEPERPGSRMEYNDKGQIVTFSGRVVDASDHLPVDNWAPEPVPKGTVKEKSSRSRPQLNGSRDLEAAMQREERYQRERAERERIRHATSMNFDNSSALVTTRHDFNDTVNAGALVLASHHHADPSNSIGRNRRDQQQRPVSSYDTPPQYQMPDRQVLRERENPNSYGSSPGYDRRGTQRHSVAGPPPIPAKVPLDMGGGYGVQNEDMALSLELQSIDIGPGSGTRRPRTTARRQYGY